MINIILKTILGVMLWGGVVLVIFGVDPELISDILIPGSYLPLTILVAIATGYSAITILGSRWRGIIITCFVVLNMTMMIAGIAALATWSASLAVLTFGLWLSYQRHDKVNIDKTSINRSGGMDEESKQN